MKKLLIIFFFLWLSTTVLSQTDTVSSSEAEAAICQVMSNIRWLLSMIAFGVVIVFFIPVFALIGIAYLREKDVEKKNFLKKMFKIFGALAIICLFVVIGGIWFVNYFFTGGKC